MTAANGPTAGRPRLCAATVPTPEPRTGLHLAARTGDGFEGTEMTASVTSSVLEALWKKAASM
jgi:hypothetical protein